VTRQRFFNNPQFLAYARLLRQLHQLIRDGADESEEGEALRGRMDEPAEDLTPEEVNCLNAISADFYTLTDPTSRSQPGSPEMKDRLIEVSDAREIGDFAKALDLLRKNEASLDPAVVASWRGRIWSELGESQIAADFFQRASELTS
jgi:hypothetical protein